MPLAKTISLIPLLLFSTLASGSDAVRGDVTHYRSPNGVPEQCVAITPMPGGVYSAQDEQLERSYCGIDLYGDHTALCPKTWSTSPGTMVYDLAGSRYAGRPAEFERKVCGRGLRSGIKVAGEPTAFKVTMNGANTSATFSTSSLLYYHFSRYLDAAVTVPVSVWRSMDRKVHQQRVTRRGLARTENRQAAHMNHAAWRIVDRAESKPSSYRPTDELFTADRQSIYGIFIHPRGKRYNAEVNGSRKSGWGEGQSRDFQRTPPYLALSADQPLEQAIAHGLQQAKSRRAKGADADPRQMAWWMRELTEITLLDFIFNQQDRVGNIDYRFHWYWKEDGQVHHRLAHGSRAPADIASHRPIRLKRSWINDNDAGGRRPYANFTKKTRMLEKQRHYHPETYRRLMALERDFAAQGELFRYVRDSFGLSDRQLRLVVDNTRLAAGILRHNCEAGKLRFDLDPEAFFLNGSVRAERMNCAG